MSSNQTHPKKRPRLSSKGKESAAKPATEASLGPGLVAAEAQASSTKAEPPTAILLQLIAHDPNAIHVKLDRNPITNTHDKKVLAEARRFLIALRLYEAMGGYLLELAEGPEVNQDSRQQFFTPEFVERLKGMRLAAGKVDMEVSQRELASKVSHRAVEDAAGVLDDFLKEVEEGGKDFRDTDDGSVVSN